MIDFSDDLAFVRGKKEVVLLQSGGLDSCFLACLLRYHGFKIRNLFVDYGQNSREGELAAAKRITEEYGHDLIEAKVSMPWLKDASLIVGGHEVGDPIPETGMGTVEVRTYVPMRNHLLLSVAASYAESLGTPYIAAAVDGDEDVYGCVLSNCPDKHPTFIRKIEASLIEGSSLHFSKQKDFCIIAPLMGNSKEATIQYGTEIGCDFSLSWSCYNSGETPCGKCSACVDRMRSFEHVGLTDPAFKKL